MTGMTKRESWSTGFFLIANACGCFLLALAAIAIAGVLHKPGEALGDLTMSLVQGAVAVHYVRKWRAYGRAMKTTTVERETPIIGWRAWKLRSQPDGWTLASVSANHDWPPMKPTRGEATKGSDLGVHAYASRELLEKRSFWLRPRGTTPAAVFGTVALAGTIVEHAEGWRAELGYPQRLIVRSKPGLEAQAEGIARDLANRYGVDVDIHDDERN